MFEAKEEAGGGGGENEGSGGAVVSGCGGDVRPGGGVQIRSLLEGPSETWGRPGDNDGISWSSEDAEEGWV